MTIRSGMTARDLVRALQREGFVLKRTKGSHRIFGHTNGRRVVVAYHGLGDTFPTGTLRSMIASIGWTEADLVRLGLAE